MQSKYRVALVSVLVLGLFFLGLTASEPGKTLIEKLQKKGKVVVGIANEAPFGYIDEKGNVTGESPDIARAVLNRLGIEEMEAVVTTFGALIPGLKAGRFDMVTAGAYITSDREKEVDFGNPQYKIGSGLAVRKGNPYDLHSYEDIAANPQVKVGVMAGAWEYQYALLAGVKEAQIVTYPTNVDAIDGLIVGRVDSVPMTSVGVRDKVKKSGSPLIEVVEDFRDLEIEGKPVAGYSSVCFPKDADAFRVLYNHELEKLRAEGKVCEILTSYELFSEANCVTETITVPEVLAGRKALEEAIEEAGL